jgi:hypothetical protein
MIQIENKHDHVYKLANTIFILSNARICLGLLGPIHAAILKENGTELVGVLEYLQNQLKQ